MPSASKEQKNLIEPEKIPAEVKTDSNTMDDYGEYNTSESTDLYTFSHLETDVAMYGDITGNELNVKSNNELSDTNEEVNVEPTWSRDDGENTGNRFGLRLSTPSNSPVKDVSGSADYEELSNSVLQDVSDKLIDSRSNGINEPAICPTNVEIAMDKPATSNTEQENSKLEDASSSSVLSNATVGSRNGIFNQQSKTLEQATCMQMRAQLGTVKQMTACDQATDLQQAIGTPEQATSMPKQAAEMLAQSTLTEEQTTVTIDQTTDNDNTPVYYAPALDFGVLNSNGELIPMPAPEAKTTLDGDSVSDLEKQVHFEFFQNRSNKTPERYLRIRNYIVDQW